MTRYNYRPGFLCVHRSHELSDSSALAGWNRLLFRAFRLYVHPDAEIRRIQDDDQRHIVVIGDVFVAHGGRSLDTILLDIAGGNRSALDELSGRFAVFIFMEAEAIALHDPLGSQAVFYSPNRLTAASSHAALLAETLGFPRSDKVTALLESPDYHAKRTRFLPGDWTLFQDIVHLLPNNELSLRSGTTTRYWPRADIEETQFGDLLDAWHEYFANYVEFMRGRYAPLVGLTGGQDSRTVIATLNALGSKPQLVTWENLPPEEAARITPMVDHLGFRHRWVARDLRSSASDFLDITRASRSAAGYVRGTPVLPAQMAINSGPRSLFVKGLGGEVLRGLFNSRRRAWLPRDPEDMAYTLYAANIRHTASKEYEVTVRESIKQYFHRGNYSAQTVCGHDLGDLIYWEQRMGTWTAIQHAELAVAMATHSAMNSRRLFEIAWGIPDAERFDDGFLTRIMQHYDPRLAEL